MGTHGGGVGVGGGGVGGIIERAVSLRVKATANELALDVSVPIILDLVISSSW